LGGGAVDDDPPSRPPSPATPPAGPKVQFPPVLQVQVVPVHVQSPVQLGDPTVASLLPPQPAVLVAPTPRARAA